MPGRAPCARILLTGSCWHLRALSLALPPVPLYLVSSAKSQTSFTIISVHLSSHIHITAAFFQLCLQSVRSHEKIWRKSMKAWEEITKYWKVQSYLAAAWYFAGWGNECLCLPPVMTDCSSFPDLKELSFCQLRGSTGTKGGSQEGIWVRKRRTRNLGEGGHSFRKFGESGLKFIMLLCILNYWKFPHFLSFFQTGKTLTNGKQQY